MITDKHFGTREYGKLTITEIAKITNGFFEIQPTCADGDVDRLFTSNLLKKNPCKYKENIEIDRMKRVADTDIDNQYNVKIELIYGKGHYSRRELCLNVWIDHFLIRSAKSEFCIHDPQTWYPVQYFNEGFDIIRKMRS